MLPWYTIIMEKYLFETIAYVHHISASAGNIHIKI